MPDTEIMLNLWYIYDDLGVIYRLLARAYIDSGTDEQKRSRLRELAQTDYWVAKAFGLPERFHTCVVEGGMEKKMPVFAVAGYNQMPPLSIFEDAIQQLESELPSFCPYSVPQDPVVCVTPLMMDDSGRLYPKFSRNVQFDSERT